MSKTGYIYKFVSNDINIKELYVGSTQNIKTMKNQHKNNYYNKNGKSYNLYLYKYICDNGGWDSWNMIQIEEFKFNTRTELKSRQRYWIEQLQATLNKSIPKGTEQEYIAQDKQRIKDKKKIYTIKNKDKIKVHYEQNRDKRKERYELNKEEINKKGREYHQKNKEEINYKKRVQKYQNKFKFYIEYLEYLQS